MSNTASLKGRYKEVGMKDKGEMGPGKGGEQKRGQWRRKGGSNGRELRMGRKEGEGRREDRQRDLHERLSNSFT